MSIHILINATNLVPFCRSQWDLSNGAKFATIVKIWILIMHQKNLCNSVVGPSATLFHNKNIGLHFNNVVAIDSCHYNFGLSLEGPWSVSVGVQHQCGKHKETKNSRISTELSIDAPRLT